MGLPNGADVLMATYNNQTVQNDKKLDNDKSTAFSSLKFSSTSEDTTPPQKFNKGLDVP